MEKIPHIVHYCWFGKGKKDPVVEKYIQGWKKILPDYQFVEWNEENFQMTMYPYAAGAYKEKRYAFVSDVARVWALYTQGGIYLDTDVEICRNFTECLEGKRMVLGFEAEDHLMTAFMASAPGHPLMKEMLHHYANRTFGKTANLDDEANPIILTNLAEKRGLVRKNRRQDLEEDIVVFPQDYFSAYRLRGEQVCRTENTYTIHHFSASWKPLDVRLRKACKHIIRNTLGQSILDAMVERSGKKVKNLAESQTGY